MGRALSERKHVVGDYLDKDIVVYDQTFKVTVQRYLFGELIAVTGWSYYLLCITYHLHPITCYLLPPTHHSVKSWYYSIN